MGAANNNPIVYNIPSGDAVETIDSAYGSVGRLFSGEGLEVVWVKKEAEQIEPGWFEQTMVDLIFVVQGMLQVEFERLDLEPRILHPGELLVLPANTRCRAYRWPREAKEGTIFLAVYPVK